MEHAQAAPITISIKNTPIPSHYTIWLIGFPTMSLSSSPGNQLAQVPIANQPGYF